MSHAKVIDFPRYTTKCSRENEILRVIFRKVSRFPLHFVLYLGNCLLLFAHCLYTCRARAILSLIMCRERECVAKWPEQEMAPALIDCWVFWVLGKARLFSITYVVNLHVARQDHCGRSGLRRLCRFLVRYQYATASSILIILI